MKINFSAVFLGNITFDKFKSKSIFLFLKKEIKKKNIEIL